MSKFLTQIRAYKYKVNPETTIFEIPMTTQDYSRNPRPPISDRPRSPFRLMIAEGRRSDFLEFLTNYYDGMGTDEALDILRRFTHA